MSILIKNINVLPMTGSEDFLEDVDIYIEGERIAKIDRGLNLEAEEIVDGRGKLALPGFINSHTHLGMSLMRNYADDLELMDWLEKEIWPLEAKLTEEDIYIASKYSMIEMVKSGTTSFVDMYFAMDRVGDGALEIGMRGVLSPGYISDGNSQGRLDMLRKLHKDYHGREGLLQVWPGPHSIYTVLKDELIGLRDLAKELGTKIHIHLAETRTEFDNCLREEAMTPVQYLDSFDFFDVQTLAAHGVYLEDEDLEILADRKVSIAHNPSSNLKLASGFARTQDMLDYGINLCIGTDGASSNNNLNMVEEIHLASLLAKGFSENPKAMTAYDTLRAACWGGAVALGLEDDLGSLQEGKLADLAIFDTDQTHLRPLGRPESAIVYSAQASDVWATIIGGRIVYVDGQVLTADENQLARKLEESLERLLS